MLKGGFSSAQEFRRNDSVECVGRGGGGGGGIWHTHTDDDNISAGGNVVYIHTLGVVGQLGAVVL